jgi:glutathione S-transferase
MILYSTPTSPFGRKVKIAALVHGLSARMTVLRGDPWSADDELRKVNPLGKMPVLIPEGGAPIYDSGVILDYFDTLLDSPRLFPLEHPIDTRTLHALCDGLIEAGLLITYERQRRPEAFRHDPWIAHQLGKIERGLAIVAQSPPAAGVANAASITLACALGYFDWRKQIDWRAQYPALVDWLGAFRASFAAFDATSAEH